MSTTMNSSLVFPTTAATGVAGFQRFPKHGPLAVVPNYSSTTGIRSSSSLYKTALSTRPKTAVQQGSSSIQMAAQKTAKALLSTVSDSNRLARSKSNSASSSSSAIRSKASAALSALPTATATTSASSSASSAIPKFMPASLPLQIGIGMASACYWRGMWYVLDDQLYPENQAKSAIVSLVAGSVGLAASQAYLFDPGCRQTFEWPKTATMCQTTKTKKFLALYGLTTSCILIWRGAWVGCDVLYEGITKESALDPKHLTISGLASHGIALVGLVAMGRLSSTLGPPYHGTLIMKDEDKLNTKNLKRNNTTTTAKTMARMTGRTRMSMLLPLVGQGSKEYGRLLQWLPDKMIFGAQDLNIPLHMNDFHF